MLVGEALVAPQALSFRAWALLLPIVAIDPVAAPLLLLSRPSADTVVFTVALALGTYVVGLGCYRLGERVRRNRSKPARIAAAVTAYAVVGGMWLGVTALVALGSSERRLWGFAAGALMQILMGTLIAVAVYARATSQRAAAQAHQASAELRISAENLTSATAHWRRSTVRWIDGEFAPTLQELRAATEAVTDTGREGLLRRLDDFREVTVRGGSHSMHPRAIRMGWAAAIASSARRHGHREVIVSALSVAPPEPVGVCLVRCVDLVLQSAVAVHPQITLGRGASFWEVEIHGIESDLQDWSLLEIQARLREHDGQLAQERVHGRSVILIRVSAQSDRTDVALSPSDVRVSLWSMVSLVPITAMLVALLGADLRGVLVAATTAASVAAYTALLIPARARRNRWFTTIMSIIGAAVATAVSITAAWAMVQSDAAWGTRPWIFTAANAVGIAIVIGMIVAVRWLIDRWSTDVRVARAATARIRADSIRASGDIDRLREGMAGILHSRVQARLVAAAGRLSHSPLRPSDIQRAAHALAVIDEVDLPELRRIATGTDERPRIHEVIESFRGAVQVDVVWGSSSELPTGIEPLVADIVREGLTNAVTHGAARQVEVSIDTSGTDWIVCLRDDGTGVAPSSSPGLGAALIDAASAGRWAWSTRAHGGTELVATVTS